jgi:hypothetical protein
MYLIQTRMQALDTIGGLLWKLVQQLKTIMQLLKTLVI